jgi:predicted TIM-barrel fold metal-dependent hydrolase
LLGIFTGYGQKEEGVNASKFDQYTVYGAQWQDMDARIRFLDGEEIAFQAIYPSLGIVWEGELEDPILADALCRAYNRYALDLVAGHRARLFPAAHISIRDSDLACAELKRVAKLDCRTAFISAAPIAGRSFAHPAYDPVWASAQELDMSIGLHLVYASPLHRQRMASRSQAQHDVFHHEFDTGPASGADHDGCRWRF